ncbi:MAG TPA: hypothetical protein PLT94_08530 [Rhodocyclaceae bacterium]|nr:hypothetical protein [Rhodocyclaceae bacterium]HNB78561.1 hypothetical protein [Rhodocyclaceae bacterium]HNH98630.1 hypothetical protein [Rhodocyclaceae bacterium]
MGAVMNGTRPITAGRLISVESASALIRSGLFLSIAGDEALLRRLPAGHWIGGTIPYFMGQEGGETTRDRIFVTELPVIGGAPKIRFYDITNLDRVCVDGPENGYSLIVIPAFSEAHSFFARNAPGFEDMFVKPLLGWISGIHLSDLGSASPMVVNGETMEFDSERAVVVHVPLPEQHFARIDIINLFSQGDGDRIRFPQKGFSATDCTINGIKRNFAEYVSSTKADTRLPLVADYSGAMINVSIKGVDTSTGVVDFYAPVFDDIEYRFAAPVPDYVSAFNNQLPKSTESVGFACNCILNYLYSELEGKKVPTMLGPMTFGEIAYQLLNQTLVYLTIE